MIKEIKQLKTTIDRDNKLLEATLNLVTSNMTIGEIKQYLKTTENLERYLEKNILKLLNLEELEKNNKKLGDY